MFSLVLKYITAIFVQSACFFSELLQVSLVPSFKQRFWKLLTQMFYTYDALFDTHQTASHWRRLHRGGREYILVPVPQPV